MSEDELRELVDRQLGPCVGCRYDEGPEEECPRHGRSYTEWVEIASTVIGRQNEQLARLEAVKALCEIPDWPPQGVDINGRAIPKHVSTEDILAALSVAPQPEPEDGCAECTESGTRNCVAGCKPEPPASAEPVPDLMQALRASVEAAKKSRG